MADDNATARTNLIKKKITTPGVVYLSRLPQSMNPVKIRRIFSMYGEVGRLYLQPEGMTTLYFFLCTNHENLTVRCVPRVGILIVRDVLRDITLSRFEGNLTTFTCPMVGILTNFFVPGGFGI